MQVRPILLLTALIAGCGTTVGDQPPPDLMGMNADLTMTTPADLAGMPDLAPVVTPDLSVVVPPDLATGPDLSVVVQPDLSMAQADLKTSGDGGPCGSCTGNQICCGNSCVDPTMDPNHCGGCSNVCQSGLCGTSIAASFATMPTNWTFNKDTAAGNMGASYDGTAMSGVLTQAMNGQTGSIIYKNAVVTDSFDVTFDFRVSGGGADGLAFMIQKNGNTAVGGGGGGLGIVNLNGYGVELDCYNNGACSDVNGNHVGVDSLASCNMGQPTSLMVSNDLMTVYGINMSDGNWHTATIHNANGMVSVTVLGGSNSMAAVGPVALPGYNAGDVYYYGFAGATGGLNQKHEIRNVTITFPTPRCL